MSWKTTLKQNWKGGTIGALLSAGLGFALGLFAFGHGLVDRSYDLLFYPRPDIHADEARLIYMDDASYDTMNQPRNAPWDRAIHAKLLDYLKTDGAKSVTFDIVFSDPGFDTNADQEFARALAANGRVVIAADVTRGEIRSGFQEQKIVLPYELFQETNVTIGSAEMRADGDLIVRKHLHTTRDESLASLAWTTASLVGAQITAREKPYEHERWINYYGPPLSLPSVSYYRIFAPSNSDQAMPRGYFSNKMVFVGAHIFTKFAGERKDEFATPYSYWMDDSRKFIPGVEVQATIALNLLRGDWIEQMRYQGWWFLFFGMIIGYGFVFLRPLQAVGVALVCSVMVTFISYELFTREHLLVSWLIPVAVQIPIALAWSVVFNSIQLYVQNQLFRHSLQMYLSPKLVKKFASERDLLKPGAKKELLTICFTDIANFTSISEGLDSDELANLMNQYFQSAVSKCIFPRDGTIIKYIGDAIFAFWNAPELQADHAMRACEAAILFREQPTHYINGKALITRIGLHTGVANVGNFGSTERVDYTALGENINLASRMEGLNKYLGTLSLITGETFAEVKGRILTRFLGRFQLKGFEKAVDVHELVGHMDKLESVRPIHEAFADALKLFQQKDFAGAEAAFKRILEIKADDGPSKFYLKFMAELHEHPLPDDWAGEVELKEK